MNKNFFQTIQNLQQNNLVILRDRRSMADKELLAQLTRGYTCVDLSVPVISSRVKRDAQGFIVQLKDNLRRECVYLQNLQYVPQLLPLLVEANLSYNKIFASCTQSFALEKLATKLPNVRFVELPMVSDRVAQLAISIQQTGSTKQQAAVASFSKTAKDEKIAMPFTLEESYLKVLAKRQPVDVLSAIFKGQRSTYGGDYGEYLQKVLQSDIMFLTTVSDSEKFYCFMQAAAAQTGAVINFSKLAQVVGITPPTAKTWLNFLLGTGIVYLLEPVQHIGLKRLVSTRKLYFRDTGLACYLLGLPDVEGLEQSEYLAQLEQNYMLNKIRESYINEGSRPDLHFYRDNNKKNIDVILRHSDMLYPVMLAAKKLDAERVQFAFEVLAEYAAKNNCDLRNGAIIYPGCVTQEILPNLWQVNAGQLW